MPEVKYCSSCGQAADTSGMILHSYSCQANVFRKCGDSGEVSNAFQSYGLTAARVAELEAEIQRLRAGLEEIASYEAETYTVDGKEYSTNMWIGRYPSATKLQEIARRVLDEGEMK